jgi:HAD superfamily hydrolase (TIGR01490 family)
VSPAPRAALFDMDRTLVRVETASLYVRHQRRMGQATLRDGARVALWVAQYTLGVVDAARVTERALATVAGLPETAMASRCEEFFRIYAERHVGHRARAAVLRHKAEGHLTAVVTAASPYAARPLARLLGIDHVVASELEVRDHRLTGRALSPLCYAEGKVERAQKLAERLGFSLREATFYSDSASDLPLLLAVGEPVAVNPDPRLRREARRRGWRIEAW